MHPFNFLNYTGSFYLSPSGTWKVKCDDPIKVELLNTNYLPVPNDLRVRSATNGGSSSSSIIVNGGLLDGNYFPSFTGFRITTADGTKYEFGGSSDAVEYSVPFFGQWDNAWIANTWHLVKVISPEGNTISLNYAPETGAGKFVGSFYVSFYNSISAAGTSVNSNFVGTSGGGSFLGRTLFNIGFLDVGCSGNLLNDFRPLTGIYDGQLIRPTYLRSIETSTSVITFSIENTDELKYPIAAFTKYRDYYRDHATNNESSSQLFPFLYYSNQGPPTNSSDENVRLQYVLDQMQWRKLTGITVKDKSLDPKTVAKFKLLYSENSSERLTLEKLQVNSSIVNDLCSNEYKFEYYKKVNDKLPNYLDPLDKTDHWGFYNKHELNLSNFSSTAEYDSHKQSYSGSDAAEVLKIGTLKNIVYPTGGITTFDYEPHSAYAFQFVAPEGNISLKPLENSYALGGLRILSIKSEDGSNTRTKTYTYSFVDKVDNQAKSSGIISSKPQYTWINFEAQAYNGTQTYKRDVFSAQSLLPFGDNSNGNFIGYRQVKETEDGTGSTTYKFTNYENDSQNGNISNELHLDEPSIMRFQTSSTQYLPLNSKSLERGKLFFKEISKGNLIVKREEFYYGIVGGSDDFVPAIEANSIQICRGTDVRIATGSAYKVYTYKYLPLQEKIIDFDQINISRFSTKLIYNKYNSIGLISEIQTNTNGSKITSVRNIYVSDYKFVGASSFGDESSKAIQLMQNNSMQGVLIEQQIWNNDNSSKGYGMTDGYIKLYRSYDAKNGFINIKPEQTLQYSVDEANINSLSSTIGVNNGSYVFSYSPNYKKAITRFNNPDNAYTSRGEPIEFTDENNLTTALTYHGDANIGLIASKTVGGQTTRYDYIPLIGISSIVDANNFKITYDYDGLGRLSTVKDHWGNLLESNTYRLANSSGCNTPQLATEQPVSYSLSTASSCTGTGSLSYARWEEINGSEVNDLLNSSKYTGPANFTATVNSFEIPLSASNQNINNYGARLQGYICPPKTGQYTFWISGDNGISLRLNSSGEDPTGAVEIARNSGYTGVRQWNASTRECSVKCVKL